MEYGKARSKYSLVGTEVGETAPSTCYDRCERLSALKKVSGFRRAHCEPAPRTDEDSSWFCSEDGVMEECSVPCDPGKGTDLE